MIGKTIKDLRKKHKLTQKELSQMCGFSREHLSRVENEIYLPSKKTLLKIAHQLHENETDLMIIMYSDVIHKMMNK